MARGIGLDGASATSFCIRCLHGGSCFPSDTLSWCRRRRNWARPAVLWNGRAVNDARKLAMARKIEAAFGGVKGKTIAVLGLTFKPNRRHARCAVACYPALSAESRRNRSRLRSEGQKEAAVDAIDHRSDTYDTLEGADGVVILTEWNEFRALDFARVKAALKTPLMVDLRNIYRPAQMGEAGFRYVSVGRPDSA